VSAMWAGKVYEREFVALILKSYWESRGTGERQGMGGLLFKRKTLVPGGTSVRERKEKWRKVRALLGARTLKIGL